MKKMRYNLKGKGIIINGTITIIKKLFGKGYLNKIMGTRTNVAKPIRMDKSSPFKNILMKHYDDPEIISIILKRK